MTKFSTRACAVAFCSLLAGCVSSHPPVINGSTEMVEVGGARVDAATRTVIVTGFVNMVQGPIELFACGPTGKRHESAFVIETGAVEMQAALLLAGAEAGRPMEGLGLEPPMGSPLQIWIEWNGSDGRQQQRADSFIINNNTGKPLGHRQWIFTGSIVEQGSFKALAEESLVATYWDPWAIINLDSPLGRDDDALSLNTARLPEVGTPVTFLLQLK